MYRKSDSIGGFNNIPVAILKRARGGAQRGVEAEWSSDLMPVMRR